MHPVVCPAADYRVARRAPSGVVRWVAGWQAGWHPQRWCRRVAIVATMATNSQAKAPFLNALREARCATMQFQVCLPLTR